MRRGGQPPHPQRHRSEQHEASAGTTRNQSYCLATVSGTNGGCEEMWDPLRKLFPQERPELVTDSAAPSRSRLWTLGAREWRQIPLNPYGDSVAVLCHRTSVFDSLVREWGGVALPKTKSRLDAGSIFDLGWPLYMIPRDEFERGRSERWRSLRIAFARGEIQSISNIDRVTDALSAMADDDFAAACLDVESFGTVYDYRAAIDQEVELRSLPERTSIHDLMCHRWKVDALLATPRPCLVSRVARRHQVTPGAALSSLRFVVLIYNASGFGAPHKERNAYYGEVQQTFADRVFRHFGVEESTNAASMFDWNSAGYEVLPGSGPCEPRLRREEGTQERRG